MAEGIDAVRTSRLEVVDASGTVRVLAGLLHGPTGVFGISVRDVGGAERAYLMTDADGCYVGLVGGGNELAGASAFADGSVRVFMARADGAPVFGAGNSAG